MECQNIYIYIYICNISFQMICQKLCQHNLPGWGSKHLFPELLLFLGPVCQFQLGLDWVNVYLVPFWQQLVGPLGPDVWIISTLMIEFVVRLHFFVKALTFLVQSSNVCLLNAVMIIFDCSLILDFWNQDYIYIHNIYIYIYSDAVMCDINVCIQILCMYTVYI